MHTDLHVSTLKRFSSSNMPTVLEEELWLQMGKYSSLQWFTFEPGFNRNSVLKSPPVFSPLAYSYAYFRESGDGQRHFLQNKMASWIESWIELQMLNRREENGLQRVGKSP